MKAVDLFMLLRLKENTPESDQENDHCLVIGNGQFSFKNDSDSIVLQ